MLQIHTKLMGVLSDLENTFGSISVFVGVFLW